MKKGRKIVWTENSVQDLLNIKLYIEQDAVERSESWVTELLEAGEGLSIFAERGRIVPEFNQKDLRELLIGNYRLVYRLQPDSIEIITVFEGHRQIQKDDTKDIDEKE